METKKGIEIEIFVYECNRVDSFKYPIDQDLGKVEAIDKIVNCLQKEYDQVTVVDDEIRVFYFIP